MKSWTRGVTLYIFLFFLTCTATKAQESLAYDKLSHDLEQATYYFDNDLYGQAASHAHNYLSQSKQITEYTDKIKDYFEASNIFYVSNLITDEVEAENDLIYYIEEHTTNPHITPAIFQLADYYYNNQRYDEAISYFDMIDIDLLTEEEMSELVFKKGYCHFVKKEFQRAQLEFSFSRDIKNKYFYPINYYNGMCEYFGGDYQDAVKSFKRVEGNSIYSQYIPYYICQIYFTKKEYNKLITYGERTVLDANTKKKANIRQLLGQTYYIKEDYERALPHLEYYENETPTLTVEEFYQLAFTQYRLGYYEKAIDNFLEIRREESTLGQQVNYYLADCYIKKGDKTSARAAFKSVGDMNYDKQMQEEAIFNYGKLSSELKFEREALNILTKINNSSPYFTESQNIINDILNNTDDYVKALELLNSLPSLSPALKKTYQEIAYQRGIQLLAEGKENECLEMLDLSDTYDMDENITALSTYWRGYILMSQNNFTESLDTYDSFFRLKPTDLPEESSLYMAHYNQGYNHISIEEYYFAVDQFQEAIHMINDKSSTIKNTAIIERVLPDAYIRAGDCLFKEKKYTKAKEYYDGAIDMKKGEFVYALYQRALIEGLERDNYNKIITLEEIIKGYPTSDYADNALLQLGDTYLGTGNPIPAAKAYRQLAQDYKGKSNLINAAYLKLGLIAYNEGDAYTALEFYKKVFENNPNSTESQEALLAIEEIYIDDLAQGDAFIKFVDSLPGYEVDAFDKDSLNYAVGENKFNNGEYDEAIAALDNYLKRYNKGYYRLDARYLRGESLVLKKRYASALKDYEEIIKEGISDYYERALRKAAIISYNYTQNFTKSLNYYTKLESHTTNQESKFEAQLGAMRSAFRLSKDENVIKYANLVALNSLSSTEEKSSANYYLGKTLYKKGQLDQALRALQQVANMSTNNQAAESRYLIADIFYQKEDLEKAENQINAANEKNKAYPYWLAKNILLMSDIFVKRDDLLNARAAIEAVIENFKDDENLLLEANEKLATVQALEESSNRVKTENADGTLELDTLKK